MPQFPLSQAGAEIFERILAARGNLIALEGGEEVRR